MDLPGRQDELVARAVAANPNTVVVVNTGAPVTMPWADDAPAVLQAWFGGQEMANALADVLFGDAEPGGRLPTTFPVRLEHNPSYGNFPGELGEVRYGEGVLMGYRWYDARRLPTRFPFGHGLSYTTFELGAPEVTVAGDGHRHGDRARRQHRRPARGRGGAVLRGAAADRPGWCGHRKELKAFAKVCARPRGTDPGHADPRRARVRVLGPGTATGGGVDPGTYELHVGRSSVDVAHVVSVER